MKLKQLALVGVMMSSGMLGVASQAYALGITPSGPGLVATLTGTPIRALDDADVKSLLNLSFDLGSVYKQEEPVSVSANESGNAAAFYSTSFNANLSGGKISWDVNAMHYIACPNCYLVVKDGNQNPYAYVFNLGNWDGKEDINLSGFWPLQGSISYVEIFNNASGGGGTVAMIPEADTYAMLLAGLGLVGFAARRRLRNLA